mgnify:CR=1 FL=1
MVIMVGISEYIKMLVFCYFKKLLKICEIVKKILDEEGIKIGRNKLARLIAKVWSSTLTLARPNNERPSILSKKHYYDFIDRKMEENDQLISVGRFKS